MQSLLEGT